MSDHIAEIDLSLFFKEKENSIFISFEKDFSLRNYFLFLENEKVLKVDTHSTIYYNKTNIIEYITDSHSVINAIISKYEKDYPDKELPIILIKDQFLTSAIGKNPESGTPIIHLPLEDFLDLNVLKFSLGHELSHTLLKDHNPKIAFILENQYLRPIFKYIDSLSSIVFQYTIRYQNQKKLTIAGISIILFISLMQFYIPINIILISINLLICIFILMYLITLELNHKKEYFCDEMAIYLCNFDIDIVPNLLYKKHSFNHDSISHPSNRKRLKNMKNIINRNKQ